MTTRIQVIRYSRQAIAILFVLSLLLIGCGTTTGNSLIESDSFSLNGNAIVSLAQVGGFEAFYRPRFTTANVSDFRLCVRKIRLEASDGSTKSKDGSEDIELDAGLIDLSHGGTVSWGEANIPVLFVLKRIRVILEPNPIHCGDLEHSLKFNDFRSNSRTTLKFQFNPPVEITGGDTITLSVSTIATRLLQQIDSGDLTAENFKAKLEDIEDYARKRR